MNSRLGGIAADILPYILKAISEPISPALVSAASLLTLRLGARLIRKFVLASMPPLQARRFKRRALISHAKSPTRSKFKGAQKCFRIRFQVMA